MSLQEGDSVRRVHQGPHSMLGLGKYGFHMLPVQVLGFLGRMLPCFKFQVSRVWAVN